MPSAPDAAPPDLARPEQHDLATPDPWTDFPSEPVFDNGGGSPPADAPQLFEVEGLPSGGPCVVEPEPGTVMPLNWIRPRVRFLAPQGMNLFEIRLHADREEHDLVVYTTSTTWTMPQGMWKAVAAHLVDEPISVTVRGASWDGQRLTTPPMAAAPSSFQVAPVAVSGSIVYSSASGGTAVVRGADVTAETSRTVLRPSAVGAQCIGCHAASPDAVHVGFVQSQDGSTGARPSLGLRSTDGRAMEPGYLTAASRMLLSAQGQDGITFSRSHYTAGDRIALSARQVGEHIELVWTDLEAASVDRGVGWGVISRDGDQHDVATPVIAHDGSFVLYVSGSRASGGQGITDGDLLSVPWSRRQGGVVTSIDGAHESMWNEYAPSLTPDDRYIAFARVPMGESSVANLHAELAVVPRDGWKPARIEANNPPACVGPTSLGVGNSWPRFGPDVARIGSKSWYWVAFSSKRGAKQNAQIYVSAVIVDEGQQPPEIHSTPALYLWSQPADGANHTPSWEPLILAAE